jgi:hypothetical protein
MTDHTTADRVTAICDAIDAFQRQHRTGGALGHAQIRAFLAEHIDRALPAVSAGQPATDRDTDGSVREQLLAALDFAYCQGLGYMTPEELLAAYDASQAVLPAPTDRTADELASLAVNAGHALRDEKRHYEIACQENARLRATIDRVRRLHDALAAETDLTSPDDEITRGAAARKIAAALDGWTDPAELRRLAGEAAMPDTTSSQAQQDEAAAYLSTPCDACRHTLNWHRNDVGCTVTLCVCSRFQQPTETPS